MKPTLIGIGAQKCASSWAHMALGAHPQIGASQPKEIDYFSYYFDRGHRWYEAHFAHLSQPHRFEISPSYFHDPRAPRRLAAYAPEARVLVLLRDPVARAFSNHLHEIIKGHIPPIPFAEGLANNPSYIEQSRYSAHLDRWLGAFPRGQVHIALAEEVAADPIAEAARLYQFLGLAPEAADKVLLAERRNESDRARLPLLRAALRRGGDTLRSAGLERGLAHLKSLPPVAAMLRANSVDIRGDIPPMDPASEARLDAALAEDLARLPALLGRADLPWPSYQRRAGAAAA